MVKITSDKDVVISASYGTYGTMLYFHLMNTVALHWKDMIKDVKILAYDADNKVVMVHHKWCKKMLEQIAENGLTFEVMNYSTEVPREYHPIVWENKESEKKKGEKKERKMSDKKRAALLKLLSDL